MHETDMEFLLGLFGGLDYPAAEAKMRSLQDEHGWPPPFLKVLELSENAVPRDFALSFVRQHPACAVSVGETHDRLV